MQQKPREYTEQEQKLAKAIGDYGLRYEQQVEFGNYTVDFYISEIKVVVEADGIYGHLKKADAKRDEALLEYPEISKIWHIKGQTEKDIRGELIQAIVNLESRLA